MIEKHVVPSHDKIVQSYVNNSYYYMESKFTKGGVLATKLIYHCYLDYQDGSTKQILAAFANETDAAEFVNNKRQKMFGDISESAAKEKPQE